MLRVLLNFRSVTVVVVFVFAVVIVAAAAVVAVVAAVAVAAVAAAAEVGVPLGTVGIVRIGRVLARKTKKASQHLSLPLVPWPKEHPHPLQTTNRRWNIARVECLWYERCRGSVRWERRRRKWDQTSRSVWKGSKTEREMSILDCVKHLC